VVAPGSTLIDGDPCESFRIAMLANAHLCPDHPFAGGLAVCRTGL